MRVIDWNSSSGINCEYSMNDQSQYYKINKSLISKNSTKSDILIIQYPEILVHFTWILSDNSTEIILVRGRTLENYIWTSWWKQKQKKKANKHEGVYHENYKINVINTDNRCISHMSLRVISIYLSLSFSWNACSLTTNYNSFQPTFLRFACSETVTFSSLSL